MTRNLLPRRTLGSSGIEVSCIGIGCWGIGGEDFNLGLPMGWTGADDRQAIDGLVTAYELGANLFDTADVYGHGHSERLIGRFVREVPRREVVLVSKVGYFAGTASHGYEPSHMRRQLEQTLENLCTDHLDVYFLHHSNFGEHNQYLDSAAESMERFKQEGLIKSVGMRGPHRYARDRIDAKVEQRGDKTAQFRTAFETVRPEVLAVRDNLLTPLPRSASIFAFADEMNCGILVNKPLAQGLLTGKHRAGSPVRYGRGDHRLRKRWFRPESVELIEEGLIRVRAIVGHSSADLISVALWACLERSPHAAVLAGFMTPQQVRENLTCLGDAPPLEKLNRVREIMSEVQQRLDAEGEVFLDEDTGLAAQ